MDTVTKERVVGASDCTGAGFFDWAAGVLGLGAFLILALLPALWSSFTR